MHELLFFVLLIHFCCRFFPFFAQRPHRRSHVQTLRACRRASPFYGRQTKISFNFLDDDPHMYNLKRILNEFNSGYKTHAKFVFVVVQY